MNIKNQRALCQTLGEANRPCFELSPNNIYQEIRQYFEEWTG